MLDQCTIRVENFVQVNPEVFKGGKFKIGEAHISGSRLSYRNETNHDEAARDDPLVARCRGSIDIFEDNVLSVRTRRPFAPEGRGGGSADHEGHYISSICFNAPKILYGHNGRIIATPQELCLSLMFLQTALSYILVDSDESRMLIPGLVERSSYWESVEIAMHVLDSGRRILGQMGNMRCPEIRGNPVVREKNTVYQRGTRFTIKAYDKVAQMRETKKVGIREEQDEITRLEVQFKSPGLTFDADRESKSVPADVEEEIANGGCFEEVRRKYRLTGFNLDYLKSLHRKSFTNIRAVFRDNEGAAPDQSTKKDFWQRLLAEICVTKGIEVSEILAMIMGLGGREKKSIGETRRKIEAEIANLSILEADELLSEANYGDQPSVVVPYASGYCKRLEDLRSFTKDYVRIYGRGERPHKLATGIAIMLHDRFLRR